MWLPTPTAADIRALRNQLEAGFPVPLTDEQWSDLACRMLRIYYLTHWALKQPLNAGESENPLPNAGDS